VVLTRVDLTDDHTHVPAPTPPTESSADADAVGEEKIAAEEAKEEISAAKATAPSAAGNDDSSGSKAGAETSGALAETGGGEAEVRGEEEASSEVDPAAKGAPPATERGDGGDDTGRFSSSAAGARGDDGAGEESTSGEVKSESASVADAAAGGGKGDGAAKENEEAKGEGEGEGVAAKPPPTPSADQPSPTPPKGKQIHKPFVKVIKAPSARYRPRDGKQHRWEPFVPLPDGDCGDGIKNPHPKDEVPDKYWSQRRRLFSRYDEGIMLDKEGWYSVTPEAIADHVAERMGRMLTDRAAAAGAKVDCTGDACEGASERGGGAVVLDPFCGCGGNAVAFARRPAAEVSLVACVDSDVSKLRMAAHNAAIYGIDPDRIVFVEADALEVLEAYGSGGARDGRVLSGEVNCGKGKEGTQGTNAIGDDGEGDAPGKDGVPYRIGGTDLLPPAVDAIFLSPPWGGMDYGRVGKCGYDVRRHIRIYPNGVGPPPPPPKVQDEEKAAGGSSGAGEGKKTSEAGGDSASPAAAATELKAKGEEEMPSAAHDEKDSSVTEPQSPATPVAATASPPRYVNGERLLSLATSAVSSRGSSIGSEKVEGGGGIGGLVAYFLPRNTDGTALGRAAVRTGYRGGTAKWPVLEMEQNWLNDKFKTVTAYLSPNWGRNASEEAGGGNDDGCGGQSNRSSDNDGGGDDAGEKKKDELSNAEKKEGGETSNAA